MVSESRREDYLDAIREVGEQLGKTPSRKDMDEHGSFNPTSITGGLRCTWNEAVEMAGFEPNDNGGGVGGGATTKYGLESMDADEVPPKEGV